MSLRHLEDALQAGPTPWLRHYAAAPSAKLQTRYRVQRTYTKRTDVEYVTFLTGRITGLQSADCIEMIEIHDGGGKIETRVRESCCTVARVYSSYESERQDSGPHLTPLC